MKKVVLAGDSLTIDDLVEVARNYSKVGFSKDAKERMKESRKTVDKLVKDEKVVYGVTTGFGSLANVTISTDNIELLQKNLIMSHACGVGDPLPEDVVRGVMLLKANNLAMGYSGVKLKTAGALEKMLNKKLYPYIPEKGSVGASGDLAPLAHMVLVMAGMGEAFVYGKKVPGNNALELAGMKKIKLGAKEGLALINGTQVMTSMAALNVHDSEKILKNALIAYAASFEALLGLTSVFDPRLHGARPHDGQNTVAELMERILEGSELVNRSSNVQDPYSLRCFPQVIGASIDALEHVKSVVEKEMNSATDNPLILDGEAVSGGNFHGQPIALVMDYLGMAIAEAGNIAERRIARLVDSNLNQGLPPALIMKNGLNSGLMVPQYVAASLVSENKVLAHPASVDSIPTCANQEDHVSMGAISARHASEIINNVEHIVAIELYTALQALDFRERLDVTKRKPSKSLGEVKKAVRKKVDYLVADRELYGEIEKIKEILKSGELVSIVEDKIGEIGLYKE